MKFTILLLLIVTAVHSANVEKNDDKSPEGSDGVPKQWAVLVAGSAGWWNYRHQADICHAYQILLKRGIPRSNIIVMMKDDIARNPENPNPGVILNRPNGTDVYKGVKIDYKGNDVTPKNFLNILLGKKSALKGTGTGRVLQSGPNDNVFINFADHGGTGILCFPDDDLSAEDFIGTLNQMTKLKKYRKMVLYVEACESGSMFDNILPHNTSILASTASAYDESSYGYYCDYSNFPCLGDLYSVNWLEHVDNKLSSHENLFDQYQLVRTLTSKSHVNLYGDFSIGLTPANHFIGLKNIVNATNGNGDTEDNKKYATAVLSRDSALYWMKRMAENAHNAADKIKYSLMVSEIVKKRQLIDNTVSRIVKRTSFGDEHFQEVIEGKHMKLNESMLTCYQNLYRLFSKKCANMSKNPYVLKHFYKFANICHLDAVFEHKATSSINSICHSKFPKIIDTL